LPFATTLDLEHTRSERAVRRARAHGQPGRSRDQEPAGGASPLRASSRAAPSPGRATAEARDLAVKDRDHGSITWRAWSPRSPRSGGRPSSIGRRQRSIRCSMSVWSWRGPGVRPTASRSSGRTIRRCPRGSSTRASCAKAFLNLILNALEALEGGGRLTLSTAYVAASGTVMITIEDTGPGMTEEDARASLRPLLHHQAGRLPDSACRSPAR
jgi:hypothetical protein